MRRLPWFVAPVVVLLAVWTAFELKPKEPEFVVPAAGPAKPDGQSAPDIGIMTKTGEVRLSKLKGKVVIIDFWATWCGPCKMSIPGLVKLYNAHKAEGLEVMGVAMERDTGEGVPAFAQSMGMEYAVGLPLKREEVNAYDPSSLPMFVVVDRKGQIRFGQKGWSESVDEKLAEKIKELLAEK